MQKSTTRRLVLRERASKRGVRLSAEEMRALSTSRARLVITGTDEPGLYDIEAKNVVGTIVTPTLRVIITPKIPIKRLLFLMRYAAELGQFDALAHLEQDDDLLDVMRRLYAEALDRALAGGPIRGYQPTSEALVCPRGRLDLVDLQCRRHGVFPPIDCDFDSFTADIEPNRRLLYAAQLVTRSGGNDVAASRLRGLLPRLQEVGLSHYRPGKLLPLSLDRRFERYRAALSLAAVIIEVGSVELRHGTTESVGFLLDMDAVYEKFVVEILREALELDSRTWRYHPGGLYLDEDRTFRLTPDAAWYPRGSRRPALVLDAKYKVKDRLVREDAYQMVAYCTALEANDGVLVYASCPEESRALRHSGVHLHAIELDPDGSPDELRVRALEIATRLRQIAHRQSGSRTRATGTG